MASTAEGGVSPALAAMVRHGALPIRFAPPHSTTPCQRSRVPSTLTRRPARALGDGVRLRTKGRARPCRDRRSGTRPRRHATTTVLAWGRRGPGAGAPILRRKRSSRPPSNAVAAQRKVRRACRRAPCPNPRRRRRRGPRPRLPPSRARRRARSEAPARAGRR